MKTAQVVLDIQTQALDSSYTYAIDPLVCSDVRVGHAVLVSFRNRPSIGFVVSVEDNARANESDLEQTSLFETPVARREDGSRVKLKAIQKVLGGPYFSQVGADCAIWMAHRYIAPLSSCVRLFTPPGGIGKLVKGQGSGWDLVPPRIAAVDERWIIRGPEFDSFTVRKGATKQQAILDAVAIGAVKMSELAAEYGAISQSVASLEKKGAVSIEFRQRLRGDFGAVDRDEARTSLTPSQAEALEAIGQAVDRKNGSVVVIDGVTGSGKTEVYLQAIRRVLDEGRGAIVLVPEISLTPQTVARFRARFGDLVAVMHSRMGAGERFDQFMRLSDGEARVVVGARSALFTPVMNVGIIIIDEEHESTYKQESAPRYVSRDVASWMAKRLGATLVLGSATPSIESLNECKDNERWTHVVLHERANGKPLPPIRIVDMAQEFSSGRRSMFSVPLTSALEEELSVGHKAVLLLNQRGFAQFVLCRDCGFVPSCPNCSTSLTFHERGNKLICHHCGYAVTCPPTCPSCGSPYLKKFGAGTQRVEDDLAALVKTFDAPACEARIVRMDADSTKAKGSHLELLEQFDQPGPAVLLGTQMIAKGLDFDSVTLVGVINADTMLRLPDYRAGERTFDLIQQVAGRAGRADLEGRVIVQTYDAGCPAVKYAASYDRESWLEEELSNRRVLRFPPFVRMANILVWGSDDSCVGNAARTISRELMSRLQSEGGASEGWTVFPASPCALSKLRNVYRWHVLVTCPKEAEISAFLEPYLRSRDSVRGVNVAADVDPQSLI